MSIFMKILPAKFEAISTRWDFHGDFPFRPFRIYLFGRRRCWTTSPSPSAGFEFKILMSWAGGPRMRRSSPWPFRQAKGGCFDWCPQQRGAKVGWGWVRTYYNCNTYNYIYIIIWLHMVSHDYHILPCYNVLSHVITYNLITWGPPVLQHRRCWWVAVPLGWAFVAGAGACSALSQSLPSLAGDPAANPGPW